MEASTTRKQKGRSPRYPGIDLETAITRARQLWDAVSHNPANIQAAYAHWDYKPGSGAGAVTVAAMKAYGFVTDSGSGDARTVRLTSTAQNLLLTADPEARQEIIEHAALLPTAHADLWSRYAGHLPSDQSLKHYLILERKFTDGGASEFIAQYKRTLAFAGLVGRSGTVSPNAQQSDQTAQVTPSTAEPAHAVATTPAPALSQPPTLQIPIPLLDGGMATFSLPREMTPEAWDQMLAVLTAFKLSLVRDAE